MKTCKEYRVEAKNALSGQWATAIGIMLVYGLIVMACSAVSIAMLILGGALSCGLVYTYMRIYRGGRLDFINLFKGFEIPEFSATIGVQVQTTVFVMLWSLLFIIPGIIKTFSYAMAPYILMDNPELTGNQAITASRELMDGRKGKLFLLHLSFIGWHLLACLTLGILELWIVPWEQAAEAAFYQSICDEMNAQAEDVYEIPALPTEPVYGPEY